MAIPLHKILSTYVKPKPSSTTARKLIVMKNRTCYRNIVSQLRKLGIKPVRTVQSAHAVCCHIESSHDLEPLANHPMVARIEHDHKVRAHGAQEDQVPFVNALLSQSIAPRAVIHAAPRKTRRLKKKIAPGRRKAIFAKRQPISWNLLRIKAPNVWGRSKGGGIRVAILDTGIAKNPDLRIAGGYNAINRKLPPTDRNGHGTHVAGIAAALDNAKGIVGVGPRIKLYAVKVLDRNGEGYVSNIIEGLDWCIRNNMQIVNMSFGFQGDNELFHQMIKKAHDKGIVLIASAGNSGSNQPQLDAPAKYNETIAVAASTIDNRIAEFSSRGSDVDVTAPGVNILSTYLNGGYKRLSGTSMAAPHVTGCVALLLRLKHSLRPAAVKSLLQSTAQPLPGFTPNDEGSGLVNVYKAAASITGNFVRAAEQTAGSDTSEKGISEPIQSPLQQTENYSDRWTKLSHLADRLWGENSSSMNPPAHPLFVPYMEGGARMPGVIDNRPDFTTGTHASRNRSRSLRSERTEVTEDQVQTSTRQRRSKRSQRASNE